MTTRELRKQWQRHPCPAGDHRAAGTFGPDVVVCGIGHTYTPNAEPRFPLDTCVAYEHCGLWQAEQDRLAARRQLRKIQDWARRAAA